MSSRRAGSALAGTSTAALTSFAALVPVSAFAFTGNNPVQSRMAQLVPVFAALPLFAGALLAVGRLRGGVTPRLRISGATWRLHVVRAAAGLGGTLGLAASAVGLQAQGLSVGYATMFLALAGVWTPTISALLSLFRRARPSARRFVVSLVPAMICALATMVGFGFDPRAFVNPWVWLLAATSLLLGTIPFIQGALNSREADEFKRGSAVSLTCWEATLVASKINFWMGAAAALTCATLTLAWGPASFHPDSRSGLALIAGIALYPIYAFAWQQANVIGDKALNGIVYVLGAPLGFLISPAVQHVHVAFWQGLQQALASAGIIAALLIQTKARR